MSNLDNIISNINKDLFNIELQDIIEITYAYEKIGDKYINMTIFYRFLGDDFINFYNLNNTGNIEISEFIYKNISKIGDLVLDKLNIKKSIIDKYLQQIQNLNIDKLDKNFSRIKILTESLKYLDDIIDLVILGLPFELEKAGFNLQISDVDIEKRVSSLEDTESRIFGKMIRFKDDDIKFCFNQIKNNFYKFKHRLSDDEIKEFGDILDITQKSFLLVDCDNFDIGNSNLDIFSTDSIFNKLIHRDKYIEIFKLIFKIYGFTQDVIVDSRSSIYDGRDAFYIPNSDAYKYLNISRILALISHELEVHYITLYNNQNILGDFRGAKNLIKEEGFAMRIEKMLLGEDYLYFDVGDRYPMILLGEILPSDIYKRALYLYLKILDDEDRYEGNLLRRKRNYPLNHTGVQHKDISYTRGEYETIEYIKSGGDIRDLYIARVSFSDIKLVKQIRDDFNINILYPKYLWEILLYSLKFGDIDIDKFLIYLDKKYHFIDFTNHELSNIKNTYLNHRDDILQIIDILKNA